MGTTSGADAAGGNPDGEMNEVEGCGATAGSEVDVTGAPDVGLVAAPMGGGEIIGADTDGSVVEGVSMSVVVVDGALVVSLDVVLVEAPDAPASFAGVVTRPPITEGAFCAASAPAPCSSPPPELVGGLLPPAGGCVGVSEA
ncbi:hypothetical protein PF007_g2288 [Phytophthora fragariae]|uniref:Uncharacterized protein n=1 Tax=Phytophthora fragariae TaxID=53985 RepID=A0A6A3TGG6_9STRA|nr:hypothetical protein PF009_g11772 [Phytophthora fragariae]KAE9136175.1 hypothetical protein PF007_g2288 [Phytophthora fragariae]